MNAQMADRAQIESDWDLVAQSAPEFEADQRISWEVSESARLVAGSPLCL